MKNLFFEALKKANQERRTSSARSAHPLLKIATMVFVLLMVNVNVWGYSIPITHPSLTGVTQKAGNPTTVSSDGEEVILYYNISSGYDPDEDLTITVKTGYNTFTSDSWGYSYAFTWAQQSSTEYSLRIFNDVVKWYTGGDGNAYMQISITLTSSTPTYTVSFNAGANNVLVAGSSGISGGGTQNGSITTSSMSVLPTATPCDAAADEGWVFDGWKASSAISGEANSYTKVTTPYNPSSNITLYAVYKKGGSTIPSTAFVKQTSTMPTSGNVILSQMNDNVSAITNTTNRTYISEMGSGVSISGSNATTTDANCVWIVASPSSGQYTFQNKVTGKYIGTNSDGDGVLLNEVTNYAKWVVNSTSSNGFYLTNVGNSGHFLKYSAGNGWKADKTTRNGTTDHIYVWLYTSSLTPTGTKYRSTLTCAETYRIYYEPGCDESEISGTVPVNTNEYASGATVPVAANTMTRAGYNFVNWLCDYNSYSYDGDGTDALDAMPAHDVTMTAQWTPKSYSITLHDNNGGDNNGSASVQFGATSLTSMVNPNRTGYSIEGYYTDAACTAENKVATPVGALQASITVSAVTWTDASSHWKKDGGATFYTKWEVKQCVITLNNQSATAPGTHSVTATYGSNTNLTKIGTNPTKTDYKFGGYFTGTEGSGAQLIDKDGYWIANVDGYTDASRNWQLDATSLTLYAYWTEKSFGNPLAWCPEPELILDGTTYITSLYHAENGGMIRGAQQLTLTGVNMASGASVTLTSNNANVYFSTSTYENIKRGSENQPKTSLTFTTDVNGKLNGDAGYTIYVHFMPSAVGDGSINDVTVTATYAVPDPDIVSTTHVYTRSMPAQFAIAAKVGDIWYALPADITSASNPKPVQIDVNETNWTAKGSANLSYAMWPVHTSSSITPAPSYTANGDHWRLTGNSDKALWASPSADTYTLNNNAVVTSVGADVTTSYEWKITTTPLNALDPTASTWKYNIQSDQTNNDKYLNIKSSDIVWGTYNAGYQLTNDMYLLPLTVVENANMSVMEWGESEVAVKCAANTTLTSVKIDGTEISPVSLTQICGDIYKIAGAGMPNLSTLATYAMKQMVIDVEESSTAKQCVLTIPFILTSTNSPAATPLTAINLRNYVGSGSQEAKNQVTSVVDVVLRNGAQLDVTTEEGNATACKFNDLYIYPGGKMHINTNDIHLSNVYLRGGFSWLDASKDYRLPQMLVENGKSIVGIGTSGHGVYYDLYLDNNMYYMMALPKDVALAAVTNEEGGDDWNAWVKGYNGEKRTLSGKPSGWIYAWEISPGTHLYRGAGYEIAIKPRSSGVMAGRTIGILRFPLLTGAAWTDEATPEIYVTAWGKNDPNVSANNKGWNYIGNPFFTSFQNTDENGRFGTNMEIRDLAQQKPDGTNWNGKYEWVTTDKVKYVTVPRKMETEYDDVRSKNYKLESFFPFFIQAADNGYLSFSNGSRILKAPSLLRTTVPAREVDIDFLLTDPNGGSDNAGLTVGNDYSAEFDMDDKEKTIVNENNLKVYTMVGEYRTAFNSLPEAAAALPIQVGYIAPVDGKYIFSLDEAEYDDVEHIWLTDYEKNVTVDLLDATDSAYEFDATKGMNNTRLALNIILKQEDVNSITTDVDAIEMGNDVPTKFIYQDKMYILYRGVIYDATGKKVKEVNQ